MELISKVIKGTCSYCKTQGVAFEVLSSFVHLDKDENVHRVGHDFKEYPLFYALVSCQLCRHGSLATILGQSIQPNRYRVEHISFLDPKPPSLPEIEHLPHSVAKTYKSVWRTASMKEYNSAATEARRSLINSLRIIKKKKDIGPLKDEIKELKGQLVPDLIEWAQTIRIIGNEGAHKEDDFSAEDVDDIMNFLQMFLTCMHTMPEKVKEFRKKREAKKEEEMSNNEQKED